MAAQTSSLSPGGIARGSTPQIEIELEFDAALVDRFFLTFVQLQKVVLEKPITADGRIGNSLVFDFTQEDTLALMDATHVKIQGRGSVGEREIHTEILEMDVGEVLKEGVV